MKLDQYSNVILSIDECIESLYKGREINHWLIDNTEEYELFRKSFKEIYAEDYNSSQETIHIENSIQNVSVDNYHKQKQQDWFMPNDYYSLDIENYVLGKCNSEVEKTRVLTELEIYKKNNLYNLLKFLVYFVDILKKNNIIYGVGRGSSVSSYVLYLIGIHRVNSLKYNLDFNEFLKDK